MIKSAFGDRRIPGRDKFFAFLKRENMNLPRPKPRRTTNSNHRYRKYSNLIKDYVPMAANRLWVSDITYIDMERDCGYLHLVTDAYSHKIVGWCMADSLMAVHSIKALQMAIDQTHGQDLTGIIHHSDRGSQYCSYDYVALLEEHNALISMTEDYCPTDNAIAERTNGIIKNELVYRVDRFSNLSDAKRRIAEFIRFYNDERPHMSIGYKTPAIVHEEQGIQKKCWKKN